MTISIKIFHPEPFLAKELDLENLNQLTQKKWQRSTSGKASFFHILKALNISNNILVPSYICSSVFLPLQKLGITPIFYDIDTNDLNGSINSIKSMLERHSIEAILVASLYGNPANLEEIEKLCHEKKIKLIDDAAQSFGATLNNRFVGTFGDAGFFSFSPGKATAGPIGSLFWINRNHTIEMKRCHCWYHLLKHFQFYFCRQKIYTWRLLNFMRKLLSLFISGVEKKINFFNDSLISLDTRAMGGILNHLLSNDFSYRKYWFQSFVEQTKNYQSLAIISSQRGVPHNHKIVALSPCRNQLISFLEDNQIYSSPGYQHILGKKEDILNLHLVHPKIIEIPIENHEPRMNYLANKLKEFEEKIYPTISR